MFVFQSEPATWNLNHFPVNKQLETRTYARYKVFQVLGYCTFYVKKFTKKVLAFNFYLFIVRYYTITALFILGVANTFYKQEFNQIIYTKILP